MKEQHYRRISQLYWDDAWYTIILYLPKSKYGCCVELELRKYDTGVYACCQRCNWEYEAKYWEIIDRTENAIMEMLGYVPHEFIQWLLEFYTSNEPTK